MSEEASLDDFMDTTSSFRSDTQNDPWSKHQLSEATMQIQAGGTPSTDKSEYYNGTIPWVKTGELKQPQINSTEQTITEQGLEYPVARSKSNHQTERPGLNLDSISRVGETMERFLIEMAEPADRSA